MEDRQSPLKADATLCRDCQACLLICSLFHEGQCNPHLARLAVNKDMASYQFEIVVCQHCESPACLAACPSGAMEVGRNGVVRIVQDECSLCGACAASCPHGAISYSDTASKYLKCDLCAGYQDGPLCVQVCPVGALSLAAAKATGEES